MQGNAMRSKWFALLAREVPRPSEQLQFLWNKLQIEWFVYKHEHHFCRMVFKSRECLRASACNKLVKFLDAVDFLMERSYRHKGDQSQLNLMHKFGMECEEHYRRYTYDQLRAVPVQAEVSVSYLEAVKGVLCSQDAQSLQKVFEQTCPRYARMDKLSFITNFPSLEIHRKILLLENYHGGVLDVQQKALAIADNRYLLLDPVSVYVPLLVGIANELDMERLVEYRVQAARASLGGLCRCCLAFCLELPRLIHCPKRYCLDLARKVRESGMLMYGVSCLSEEDWMGVHADARRVVDKRRKGRSTEHADAKRAMSRFGVQHFPMWAAYLDVESMAGAVLEADDLSKNLTRHLPPTSTRVSAHYDLEAFLKSARSLRDAQILRKASKRPKENFKLQARKSRPDQEAQARPQAKKSRPDQEAQARPQAKKSRPDQEAQARSQAKKRRGVSGLDL